MERAFRLAGLLRLRKLQEDQAAAALALANADLRVSETRRHGSHLALAHHTLPDGDHRTFATALLGRAALGELLVEATTAAAGAREQVALDTGAWSAARSLSVGLEKLEDKHRVVIELEDDRLEQIVLDEIASRSAHAGGAGAGGAGAGSPAAGTASEPAVRR